MSSEPGLFDLRGFGREIDRERVARGLTWVRLSREVGVAASTIRRFETADDAEADGVLALLGWLDATPEQFVIDSTMHRSQTRSAGVSQ